MNKLIFFVLIFLFQSFNSFSHEKGKESDIKTDRYICYKMGESSAIFQFSGGDGKFGSEQGSFEGVYKNLKIDKTTKYILKIHGDRFNGGYIKLYLSGKLMNYATILPDHKLKEMPHSSLKNKNNVDDQILWLSAFRSNYKRSVFMTFVRSTLRMKTFGNSPTLAVGFGRDSFFDCKSDK